MATSRIMPRHVDEGRSILATIARSLDYGKNPDKTRDGFLVSSYECDPRTAAMEFVLAKNQYASITGREQNPEHDILLYQIRQSFVPGEITAEEANRVAYELAMRFTKGKHAFLVCTHEDQKHIHTHIYYNSTTLDCGRKFNNFLWSSMAVRRVSDRLCLENGLSIVENPGRRGKHYGAWLSIAGDPGGDKRSPSFQAQIKAGIDAALEQKPASFDDFLRLLKEAGFTVNPNGRRQISVMAPADGLLPGQKKPTRLDTLKGDYTEQAICERIEGKRVVEPKRDTTETPAADRSRAAQNLQLLIDIQNSVKAKDSPGYERWAKLHNIKQLSQTVNFVTEHGLTLEALDAMAKEAAARFGRLSGKIRAAETRMEEIAALQKQIGIYGKTRDVYAAYRKAGYSKKFLAEHEREIAQHKEAKKVFDALGLEKIPSIKALQQEYAALMAEKKKLYSEYHAAKKEMKDTLTAKSNLDTLLRRDEAEPAKQSSRPEV